MFWDDFCDDEFDYDSLFYHTQVKYENILRETELAICFSLSDYEDECWLPKKLIRKLDEQQHTVYVWTKFWVKKEQELKNSS